MEAAAGKDLLIGNDLPPGRRIGNDTLRYADAAAATAPPPSRGAATAAVSGGARRPDPRDGTADQLWASIDGGAGRDENEDGQDQLATNAASSVREDRRPALVLADEPPTRAGTIARQGAVQLNVDVPRLTWRWHDRTNAGDTSSAAAGTTSSKVATEQGRTADGRRRDDRLIGGDDGPPRSSETGDKPSPRATAASSIVPARRREP